MHISGSRPTGSLLYLSGNLYTLPFPLPYEIPLHTRGKRLNSEAPQYPIRHTPYNNGYEKNYPNYDEGGSKPLFLYNY
jgi:hypothetical protein